MRQYFKPGSDHHLENTINVIAHVKDGHTTYKTDTLEKIDDENTPIIPDLLQANIKEVRKYLREHQDYDVISEVFLGTMLKMAERFGSGIIVTKDGITLEGHSEYLRRLNDKERKKLGVSTVPFYNPPNPFL